MSSNEVEMRVSAAPAQLPVLRSVASVMAIREDFDLDAIADFKMAVDEACSMLMVQAIPESTITCRFYVAGSEIWFSGSALSAHNSWPDTSSFGWHVLSTLTNSLNAAAAPAPDDQTKFTIRIELSKKSGTNQK